MDLHSDFIKTNFSPCFNIYESDVLKHASLEQMYDLIEDYKSPNDRYLYPVVDLDLNWALYLNWLTINEAVNCFAFGSNIDGKVSIGYYDMIRLLYCTPEQSNNNLMWVDMNGDWTKPLD